MRGREEKVIGIIRILCVYIFTYTLYLSLTFFFLSHLIEYVVYPRPDIQCITEQISERKAVWHKAFIYSLTTSCFEIVASQLWPYKIILSTIPFFIFEPWGHWLWDNHSLNKRAKRLQSIIIKIEHATNVSCMLVTLCTLPAYDS